MLRKRVITVLTFCDGVLFRTKLFHPDYRYTLNFVDAWSVDEIIVLDVTRPRGSGRESFCRVIGDFARRCFVPLTAGGGISSIEDVRLFMSLGADKITVNSAAIESPSLIRGIAKTYGEQSVVCSIDVKKVGDDYEVYSDFGSRPTGLDPVAWARQCQEEGAGEILVTSIDRDGSLQGYDLELCQRIANAVRVPTLILGGCGNWKHMERGFKDGLADAVCTQNIYHFTETSIQAAKAYLSKAGISVRA